MKNFVALNGKIITETQAHISINDRAFLFGDGIFETCKILQGKIVNYLGHESRIKKGLKALKFSADVKDLKKLANELIRKNQIDEGILKIIVSRGSGSVGYLPLNNSSPTILLQTFLPRQLPKIISLGISTQTTPAKSLGKTLNCLPYVLGKIEAQQQNLFDCVLLSQQKFIAETSSANIFWIKNGKVFTAKKSCGIVAGTIREKLLKISPVKIFEVEAKISALKNADEIFLTNAAFGVILVDKFLGKNLQKNFGQQFLELVNHWANNATH